MTNITGDDLFFQGFMAAVRSKIPHKATLANTIAELLDIDKDAVYRRLRGEVKFSFSEMAMIAKSLGISLDNIAGIDTEQSKPAKMNIARYSNPHNADYDTLISYIDLLKTMKDEPDSKIMESANLFPHALYLNYENITRFFLFKWNQTSGYGNAMPFHEITLPKRLRDLQKQIWLYTRNFSSTQYVFDSMIFQRLVTDIKYFARIRLIKEEDVSLMKNELTELLENMENMAITGKYEETGNEVSFFISDIDFDTNYSCLESNNLRLTRIRTFILNSTVTSDEEVFNETSAWIRSLQRMSTLISVSGAKIRSMFFDTQRMIVSEL